MKIHDCDQRSPEWHALKLGKFTASRSSDMLAKGEGKSRRNLLVELALERVTRRSQARDYVSRAMQDGIDREEAAAAKYMAITGRIIDPVGFVSHDSLLAGCSPDSFVGEDGLVSIKCPSDAVHWEYLRTSKVPSDYVKQVIHEFWITGRTWCDWLSFNPNFPEPLQAKLVRIVRDEPTVADYDAKARAFLAEVDAEVMALATMAGLRAVLGEAVA